VVEGEKGFPVRNGDRAVWYAEQACQLGFEVRAVIRSDYSQLVRAFEPLQHREPGVEGYFASFLES
jgi:hypothetical protein